MNIIFEKITNLYQEIIFTWLTKPHVIEFWDNSQEHLNDIINFINGRKEPSNYLNGIYTYWIGKIDNEPYCLILTAKTTPKLIADNQLPKLWKDQLSETSKAIGIDFLIGNEKYLNKGLANLSLETFINFYQTQIDNEVDLIIISPDKKNSRAKHVYNKAGFIVVGEFTVPNGEFEGRTNYLMARKLKQKATISPTK